MTSTLSISPRWSNRKRQTLPLTSGGMAQTKMITPNVKLASGVLRHSTSAASSPPTSPLIRTTVT